jgi:hypothetical protein
MNETHWYYFYLPSLLIFLDSDSWCWWRRQWKNSSNHVHYTARFQPTHQFQQQRASQPSKQKRQHTNSDITSLRYTVTTDQNNMPQTILLNYPSLQEIHQPLLYYPNRQRLTPIQLWQKSKSLLAIARSVSEKVWFTKHNQQTHARIDNPTKHMSTRLMTAEHTKLISPKLMPPIPTTTSSSQKRKWDPKWQIRPAQIYGDTNQLYTRPLLVRILLFSDIKCFQYKRSPEFFTWLKKENIKLDRNSIQDTLKPRSITVFTHMTTQVDQCNMYCFHHFLIENAKEYCFNDTQRFGLLIGMTYILITN